MSQSELSSCSSASQELDKAFPIMVAHIDSLIQLPADQHQASRVECSRLTISEGRHPDLSDLVDFGREVVSYDDDPPFPYKIGNG